MAHAFSELLDGITDPVILFGHFTYLLLIVSMLMRRMVWLRSIAVASGVAKIIYRSYFVIDPVSAVWETIFVAVNLGQLVLIWYYERHHKFAEDERHFVGSMPPGIERRAVKRILEVCEVREVAAGATLTVEGEPVQALMYVASGVATIERAGVVVAACGPGDYIGEMSFLTGRSASATARAVKSVRVLAFDQAKLRKAIETDIGVRRAMESSLNLNLVGKLTRANEHQVIDESA